MGNDKQSPAVVTRSFDAWLREHLAEQEADEVEALIACGWTWSEALAFVTENPEEAP